jgi:hypothetical protein
MARHVKRGVFGKQNMVLQNGAIGPIRTERRADQSERCRPHFPIAVDFSLHVLWVMFVSVQAPQTRGRPGSIAC